MEQVEEFLIKFDQDVLFPAKVKITRMRNKIMKWKNENKELINFLEVCLFVIIVLYVTLKSMK